MERKKQSRVVFLDLGDLGVFASVEHLSVGYDFCGEVALWSAGGVGGNDVGNPANQKAKVKSPSKK